MKAYTDLEQSKQLAEILPIESADMFYLKIPNSSLVGYNYSDLPYFAILGMKDNLPVWSLSALLEVLPEGIIENYYVPNLQKENGKYSIAYGNEELLCIADNPIDACVEMIIKLKEKGLI